jgi:hypothetical protein
VERETRRVLARREIDGGRSATCSAARQRNLEIASLGLDMVVPLQTWEGDRGKLPCKIDLSFQYMPRLQ